MQKIGKQHGEANPAGNPQGNFGGALPAAPFEIPFPDQSQERKEGFGVHTEVQPAPANTFSKAKELQLKYRIDPLTASVLANMPNPDGMKIGSYVDNGEIFVYVDCLDREDAERNDRAKTLAYQYRLTLNMPTAGIEPYGGVVSISSKEQPEPLFPDADTYFVYRATFRLTAFV